MIRDFNQITDINKSNDWKFKILKNDSKPYPVYKLYLKNKQSKNGLKICLLCCFPCHNKKQITICNKCSSKKTNKFYQDQTIKYKKFCMSNKNYSRILKINILFNIFLKNHKKSYCNKCMKYQHFGKTYCGNDFKCSFCIKINKKIYKSFFKKKDKIKETKNNIIFDQISESYILLHQKIPLMLVKYIKSFNPYYDLISLIKEANYYDIEIPISYDYSRYIKVYENKLRKKIDKQRNEYEDYVHEDYY